jgi:hypothetical protein
MGLLELVVVVLVIAWVLGGFVFPVGNAIHLLLVLIVVIVLIKLLRGERL